MNKPKKASYGVQPIKKGTKVNTASFATATDAKGKYGEFCEAELGK